MTKQFVVAKRSVGIKCVVNIQLTKFKGQAPYFSVTGEAYRITGRQGRPPMLASGCIHDYIQRRRSDEGGIRRKGSDLESDDENSD